MKKLSNFINGELVDSTSGETTTLINPATAEAFATAPKSNAADVDLAMKSAAAAFEGWRDSTVMGFETLIDPARRCINFRLG